MDEAESATKALGLDEPPQRADSDTESEAEVSTMDVMAPPGNIGMGAEAMPNPDEAESSFAEVSTVAVEDVQAADDVFTNSVDAVENLPEHVLSGRSPLELGEGLSSQKTTLIVVHTDSGLIEQDTLKSTSAISTGLETPPTPLTPPLSQDKDPASKYNWDPSVYNNELPVRCRNTGGALYKNRLGSGGKGRCIKHDQKWLTPTEFEGLAGRASSKDWKRSIRYAGRPLLCLIQVSTCLHRDRILNPHAASCTCAACCDEMVLDGESLEAENITMNGPVRLFVPYKRRRKETDPPPVPAKKEVSASKNIMLSPGTTFTVSPMGQITPSGTLTFERSPTSDTAATAAAAAAIISDASAQNEVYTDTAVLTALPTLALSHQAKMAVASPSASPVGTLDAGPVAGPLAGATATAAGPPLLSEGPKNAWQCLEEMVNTLMSSVQQLKALIEQAKRDNKGQKECAVSQSLQNQITFQTPDNSQAKRSADIAEVIINVCENCGRVALSECTGCRKVNYCSIFCQRKDWRDHQNACCQSGGGGAIAEDEPMASVDMDKVK
ncbi:deformed epidermal autoregulatory factor 1 homolog isoform X2 [Phyllopteryx taeniolatus]|uniref:deformed epidermal autoregulatory factor 1 homolog isoform X2 n=1 Tax=Phyllopteryx taeniolatus TaxID=161469 RepID=UPI002AD31B38|nr:deformed epidermal autoregulatory factor 1 homolog isoform X2 [Phyllopteryx taeniolatus]